MTGASSSHHSESFEISALKKIRIFLEMIKFEHSIFALPFAYLGMILASNGHPGFSSFLWITIAMVSFRTMAMAANRLIDHGVDARNPRTAKRALPAGLLKRTFVWGAAIFSGILFELVCLKLGRLCFYLSPVPFTLAWLYPFMKRGTWLCHFVLGLVLGIAPYGAWLAIRPEFSWIPGFFTLGVLFWVAGFDIIYALLDLDFDRENGLHSVPAKLGDQNAKVLARVLHILTFVCWIAAGKLAGLGWIYFSGLLIAAVLMLRQHGLVREGAADPVKINEAFFVLNAWISILVFVSTYVELLL